jgi:hypothetical protein
MIADRLPLRRWLSSLESLRWPLFGACAVILSGVPQASSADSAPVSPETSCLGRVPGPAVEPRIFLQKRHPQASLALKGSVQAFAGLPPTSQGCLRIELQGPTSGGVALNPILFQNRVFRPSLAGNFKLELPWSAEKPRLDLLFTQVSERGEILPTRLLIELPAPPPPEKAQDVLAPSRWRGDLGSQWTSLSYKQTRLATPYSAQVLTLKGALRFRPWTETEDRPRPWSFDLSAFLTAFHFSESLPASARFLGLNLRAHRTLAVLTSLPGKPTLDLGLGPYYVTMFLPAETFGFVHLGGLQIIPGIRWQWKEAEAFEARLKVSTVNEGLGLRSLSNLEWGLGAAYQRQKFRLLIDYSRLQTQVESEQVDLSTFSIGVGYSFGASR